MNTLRNKNKQAMLKAQQLSVNQSVENNVGKT
jgi:hypothetical protein